MFEIGLFQPRTYQTCLLELGSLQHRLLKLGLKKIDPAQVSEEQINILHLSFLQIRLSEISAAELRALQILFPQINLGQVSALPLLGLADNPLPVGLEKQFEFVIADLPEGFGAAADMLGWLLPLPPVSTLCFSRFLGFGSRLFFLLYRFFSATVYLFLALFAPIH